MNRPTSLPALDVVIPTLNAAADLPATLAALPPGAAVIISDGGSTDATVDIAGAAGCRIVIGPRGRGGQLRRGAEAATRAWRLFLHADTTVSPDGWSAIARHINSAHGADFAASLRLSIRSDAWQARWVERGVALRVRCLGLPYGDQGLLIHRDLYAAIGGYSDQPLMEDVEILGRLGRSRHVALDGEARTSAARWERRGWFGQTVRNMTCLALYRSGVSAQRIVALYER